MRNGRKTVSSRRGQVGRQAQGNVRHLAEGQTCQVHVRSLAGTGRSGFLYNSLRRSSFRRIPVERNNWRNMKKILFGRNLMELCLQKGLE